MKKNSYDGKEYSVSQYAKLLGVTTNKVYYTYYNHKLECKKIGTYILIKNTKDNAYLVLTDFRTKKK